MADAILSLAAKLGILQDYTDTTGTRRVTTPDTAQALLAAMGTPVDNDQQARAAEAALDADASARRLPHWLVAEADAAPVVPAIAQSDWQLTLENGQVDEGQGSDTLPVLPLGIHRLTVGAETCVIMAAPRQLPLPAPAWGLMVPLWGLKGAMAGGLGDYADLAQLSARVAPLGCAFLGINPIHAGFPTDDGAYSPYTPSHRRRLNTLHIPVDGAGSTGPLIDYPAEFALRRRALRDAFAADPADAAVAAFAERAGPSLLRFAKHQALASRHGAYWSDWPAALRDPASEAVDKATADLSDEIAFHLWTQWRAETTLGAAQDAARAAGARHGLYLDLAVGVHPAGAETWEDPGAFVRNVSLGAPPDALGLTGQTWNLAPFDPKTLIARAFAPLAETLRYQLRFCGVLRIDHILGFQRAFWVPDGGAPGAYVSMPLPAMLAVARIEAARAGAVIVGEDLGVVPEGLRAELAASGILGCRLAMFERDADGFAPAAAYPQGVLASFSTHDLPTWAGWRSGRDLRDWHRLGALNDQQATLARQERQRDVAALDAKLSTGGDASMQDLHAFLARTPSRLVAVQAETILGMNSQPNMPGIVEGYPNWRQRLTVSTADLAAHPDLANAAKAMAASGRG
ncbi:MAG: 4-alpha-glucanotransferase [Pseudomonadota bacterium]